MPFVQGGALLHHLVGGAREGLEGHRPRGWTWRGARPRDHRAGVFAREGGEQPAAERALARSHRGGRVALEDLRGAEALLVRGLEVFHLHVLTEADVAARGNVGEGLDRLGIGCIRSRPGHSSGLRRCLRSTSGCHHVSGCGDPDIGKVHRHAQQSVARRQTFSDHHRVTRDRALLPGCADRDRTNPPAPLRPDDPVGTADHLHDVDARIPKRLDVVHTFVGERDHHGAVPGTDAVRAGQSRSTAAEEHAGQIASVEDGM